MKLALHTPEVPSISSIISILHAQMDPFLDSEDESCQPTLAACASASTVLPNELV